MGLFDRREKKSINANDGTDQSVTNLSYAEYIRQEFDLYPNVPPRTAYNLFFSVSALGDAVGKIANAISSLQIGLEDDDGNVVYDAEALTRLNNPGEGYTRNQFWRELAISYALTNEAWFVARGNITREPLAYTFIKPYDIDVYFSTNDGLPLRITTSVNRDRRLYNREIIDGKLRFIDREGLNEIVPTIGTVSINDDWRGTSRLSSLFYDLQQQREGKKTNLSKLKNGLTTSGILSPRPQTDGGARTKWTQKIVDAIQDRLRAFNQGSGNAGNVMILGEPATLEGLSITNKDMEYAELLKGNNEAIYNAYDIPLALISSAAMTLDNYTTAQKSLYLESVFPMFDDLGSGIIQFLRNRFPNLEGQTLTFNELEIRALRDNRINEATRMRTGAFAETDEIRSVAGLPERDQKDILVPSTLVPLEGMLDLPPGDEPQEPTQGVQGSDDGAVIDDQGAGVTLNGAQVTAALSVVTSVHERVLPLESGINMLMILFNLTEQQAVDMIGPVDEDEDGEPDRADSEGD